MKKLLLLAMAVVLFLCVGCAQKNKHQETISASHENILIYYAMAEKGQKVHFSCDEAMALFKSLTKTTNEEVHKIFYEFNWVVVNKIEKGENMTIFCLVPENRQQGEEKEVILEFGPSPEGVHSVRFEYRTPMSEYMAFFPDFNKLKNKN